MFLRRIKQVFFFGWKDAGEISKKEYVGKGRLCIFLDILHCFFKYNIWSNQYKKEKLYLVVGDSKRVICKRYLKKNKERDSWVKAFFANYRFLNKWSSFRFERSATLQNRRLIAYKKRYGLGDHCFIGYDVKFHKHHYSRESLRIGHYCQISEHVDLDYTGGLTIGNGVGILDGVKVLTHGHDYLGIKKEKDLLPDSKRAFLSPLEIGDNVTIGSHAIIMPGVHYIGKNAMISAGSIVTKPVPENAVVAGNPSKMIGSIEGMNIFKRDHN